MPFELHEILETIRMTEVEHFDIRTLTLGISLRDCASHSAATTREKVYTKICRIAEHHLQVANELEHLYGIRIANKRVSVTPIALLADGFTQQELLSIARRLDDAAKTVGVDFLAGYSALVEKGPTSGDATLMASIPEALAHTERLCASVNCGATRYGLNVDITRQVADIILDIARLTARSDSVGCARFVAFCNAVQDNPFVAGAFHGVGEPEAVINVGISGPGVVLRAVKELGENATFDELSETIKRTAFKITRAGQLIGMRHAQRLNELAPIPILPGIVDLSLAPTPAIGDSVADILKAMGLEDVGAPGTTAALALLNEAVKRGGLMAATHVGGLSGAFIPVSEDQGMINAVAKGHLSMEKLEAMTAICSVGLDMVAIPGDTSAETIAGILLDEFAIGLINDKTTAVRLIPVQGKTVGDMAEFGGLLGRAPIMPVSNLQNHLLINRGGRMPAPIRSLTN